MATLLPNGKQTFTDANGNPLASGFVYFYVPGTTTAKNTWQDAGQTILNTNPVELDNAGRAIIYGSGAYRQVVKDVDGNTVWDQTTSDTSAAANSWAATSTGTANAQAVSASNFTSSDGQSIDLIWGFSNNSSLTVNPNGTGPISVLRDTFSGPVACIGGEAVAGNLARLVYSEATGAFHLTSYPLDDRTPFVSVASAGTVNLGAQTSRNITITGTTTITSFGSSASTSYPVYRLTFTGALLLTHNGTSLILPGTANITTAANDSCVAIYLGAGNWLVTQYSRANGKAVVETDQIPARAGKKLQVLTTIDESAIAFSPFAVIGACIVTTNGTSNPTMGTKSNTITSVSRSGVGTWDFVVDLPTADYAVMVNGGASATNLIQSTITGTPTTTAFTLQWYFTNAAGATDPAAGNRVDIIIVRIT